MRQCQYCKAALPGDLGDDGRVFPCPTCARPLLARERILGVRVSRSGVMWAGLLFLLLPLPLIAVTVVVGFLTRFDALLVAALLLEALPLGAILVHDGFLSIRTRIHNSRAEVSRGDEAVMCGTVELVLGTVISAICLYSLVACAVRLIAAY